MEKEEISMEAARLVNQSDMTSYSIAKGCGLSTPCIDKIRNGSRPNMGTARRIIAFFNGEDACTTSAECPFDERMALIEQIDRLTRIVENLTK